MTRAVGRALGPLSWVIVALLAVVCLLHAVGTTSRYWEIAAVSLTPWVLLPAWPIGLVAGWRRHWVLLGVTVALVACQLIWVGPQFKPWSDAPAPATAQRLRLFDANVSQSNPNLAGIAGEIKAARPQIVALEELTPQTYASLQATGVMALYPYRLVDVVSNAGGMGLWSTLPLSGTSRWDNQGGQTELEATVAFAGKQLRVDVAHVFAPVGFNEPALWNAQLGRLAAHLKAEPRPLVVAGDFNATTDLQPFRSILDDGMSDAAVMAGQGWRMTWPRNQAWVLPYLRLDHVLLSPQLTVTGYRLGTGRGSDHKPLVVDIAWAR